MASLTSAPRLFVLFATVKMSRFVIDSCVAFKWGVKEADSDKANKIRADYQAGIHELLAPDVFPVEIGHAITRAERQGRIIPAEGAAFLADLMTTLPALENSLLLLPRAYDISSSAYVGIYDCLYVALAERETCDLITSDDKLIKNLHKQFPFIKSLALLP